MDLRFIYKHGERKGQWAIYDQYDNHLTSRLPIPKQYNLANGYDVEAICDMLNTLQIRINELEEEHAELNFDAVLVRLEID